MNDKIRMLEAKRTRLINDLAQMDLALRRARTGYVVTTCRECGGELWHAPDCSIGRGGVVA